MRRPTRKCVAALSAKSDILTPQIGELSAVISQQASPPQAKQILVWQVLVERRMKYDLSARTALALVLYKFIVKNVPRRVIEHIS